VGKWKKYSLNEITCRMLGIEVIDYPGGDPVYHKFNNDRKGPRKLECKIFIYQDSNKPNTKLDNFYWHYGIYSDGEELLPEDLLEHYKENLINKDCKFFFDTFRECAGISKFAEANTGKQEQTNINQNKPVLRGKIVMNLTEEQVAQGFELSLGNIKEGNGKFGSSGKILVDWLADLEPMKFSALVDNAKEIRTLKRQSELEKAQAAKEELGKKYEELSASDKEAYKDQAAFLKARNSDWFEYLKIVSPDGVMTTTDTGSYKDSVWQRKDQKWGRKPKWLIEEFKKISSPEQVESLFSSKTIRPLGKLILPDRAA
jgi:hypothetical protein